jgi:hypothetical protein
MPKEPNSQEAQRALPELDGSFRLIDGQGFGSESEQPKQVAGSTDTPQNRGQSNRIAMIVATLAMLTGIGNFVFGIYSSLNGRLPPVPCLQP